MLKCKAIHWRTGVVLSLAALATGWTAMTQAGPGCMNGSQYMTRGYYPYSPMGPQPAYGPTAAYGPYAGPARGMTAPAYARPMPAQRNTPVVADKPAMPAAVNAGAVQPTRTAATTEDKSPAESVTVRIDGMRFEPENLTVKPGTRVTWIQGSRMPHTITGNDSVLRSNTLYTGQQFSHTFGEAGRYDYSCSFHPSMKGSITVEDTGVDS
jgi:plastocyanin